MFVDSEFVEACAELDNPDVAEWEFFTESHGVKIYRQYNEVNKYIYIYVSVVPGNPRQILVLSIKHKTVRVANVSSHRRLQFS